MTCIRNTPGPINLLRFWSFVIRARILSLTNTTGVLHSCFPTPGVSFPAARTSGPISSNSKHSHLLAPLCWADINMFLCDITWKGRETLSVKSLNSSVRTIWCHPLSTVVFHCHFRPLTSTSSASIFSSVALHLMWLFQSHVLENSSRLCRV